MGEDWSGEMETDMVEGLTLGLDGHPKGQTDGKLNSAESERKSEI